MNRTTKRTPGTTLAMAFVAWYACEAAIAAEPYLPQSEDQVLLSLPIAAFGDGPDLPQLRNQLAEAGDDPQAAVRLARRCLKLGAATGDARYYGHSRAAIAPWWNESRWTDETLDVLRIRAKLRERNHEYAEALADLATLLGRSPRDAQAWLETANLHRVRGDYEQAQLACEALAEFADPFVMTLCRAPLLTVTRGPLQALKSLDAMLPVAEVSSPESVTWILTMQGEAALAAGLSDVAERKFKQVLASEPENRYVARAYAEQLIESGRPSDALNLVASRRQDDGLLLCEALAARACGDAQLVAELQQVIADRFAEVRLRGDVPLGRFESIYVREFEHDASRALRLALDNWNLQKEPHDTEAVLRAAIAAHDKDAAEPVANFVRRHDVAHATVKRLMEQWERLP
ncbi:MAG: hypothetical protein KDA61_01525 [Planctomycetales bacterium]|nr:hypothetical protein [Planctomycetales bacterium]